MLDRHAVLAPTSSPEYDLVRLAARAELDGVRAARFREAVEGPLDWKKVMAAGSHHRVLPLLYIHLREHAAGAPPDAMIAVLQQFVQSAAVRVLFLSSQMALIARQLNGEGVPFLVLKGPTLSEAYGGAARRPFSDNDLLIRHGDFGRVERALLDLGFNRRKRSQRQLEGHLLIHREYTFGRAVEAHVSTVDVHTSVAPLGYTYDGSYDRLASRGRTVAVGGAEVQALGWSDLFLVLCVNALKDQWDRLRLASDLAELADHVADWDQAESEAESQRSLRAFRIGVLVAADELDGRFPQDVLERARADREASELARTIRAHFPAAHNEQVLDGSERARLMLRAQDGIRGQARYLSYVAVRRLLDRWVSPHPPGSRPASA